MLSDLAILDAHGIDGFELDIPARCRNAEERAFVGAVIRLERRDHIAVGGLPVDDGMKVGKRRSQRVIKLARSALVRRSTGLRCMIDKVVGKELFKQVEVAFALDLFCVATNDRLCSLADAIS